MFKRWANFILILAMLLSFSTVFADSDQTPVNGDGGTVTTDSRYILQD